MLTCPCNVHLLHPLLYSKIWVYKVFYFISVFEMTAFVKTCKYTVFFCCSFCQINRVTAEALIAETVVWPNFSLMNVFFALKGSNFLLLHHFSYFLALKHTIRSSVLVRTASFWVVRTSTPNLCFEQKCEKYHSLFYPKITIFTAVKSHSILHRRGITARFDERNRRRRKTKHVSL